MSLRSALCFFTRLPIGTPAASASFEGVVVWLPAVGLVVGLVTAAAVGLAGLILPASLCGVAGCLAWTAVTGGLHLDGVADCGDGLLVEASRERRLEIMKDSRLGTFGGLALFFVLAVKIAALAAAAEVCSGSWSGFGTVVGICCAAAVTARCSVVLACRLPSARPGGLGTAASRGVGAQHERWAIAAGLAICAVNGLRGLAALIAALIAACIFLSAARKRLGGVTGDVYGCLSELVECAVLTACCAVL